jgi:hypothetical protein
LTALPVLQASKSGVPFKLYVAAEDSVISAVLTQETDGKEYIIALHFFFSSMSSFKFIWLHRSISDKLVIDVLLNNPRV